MSLLCKLFKFLLNVFTQIVEVVASAVKTIGTAVVDVLSDLVESAGNALFGGNGFLTLLLVGGGLYFLFGRDKQPESTSKRKPTVGVTNGT